MGSRTGVGFGKFLIMLLVTWLTPFPGLANLLFLWPFPYYRAGASTALGVSIACFLVVVILTSTEFIGVADVAFYVTLIIILVMKIWMTMDAVRAFAD